jgi:hypothetical protein
MTRLRALALSGLVHALLLGVASFGWLVTVERVPEPPIIVRFVAGPPLARMARPRTHRESPPPMPDAVAVPAPEPVRSQPVPPTVARPAEPPAAATRTGVEPRTTGPDLLSVPQEAAPVAPAIAEKDDFALPALTRREPPAGSSAALALGRVDRAALGTVNPGSGPPDAEILQRVAWSGNAGAGGGFAPGTGAQAGALAGGQVGAQVGAQAGAQADAQPGADSTDVQPAGTRPSFAGIPGGPLDPMDAGRGGAAVLLGRRYHVDLVDARALGRSTHDGWRYDQLLPLLSEAYRRVASLAGVTAHRHGSEEDVRSIRVDPDAIAITYADGTQHVVTPTRDGLVALYVTATAAGRSKVDEIQKALAALRRMLVAEDRS